MVSSAVANISKHRKSEKQQKEATPPILSMENNLEKKMYYFLWMLLVIQCMYTSVELQVFEPFNILGLQPGASDSELKKAYRKMSVQHHPDKNPNPGSILLDYRGKWSGITIQDSRWKIGRATLGRSINVIGELIHHKGELSTRLGS